MLPADALGPGEIGFLTASIKQVRDTRVGDTITHERKGATDAAPRLQALDPGGLLRPLPGRRRRLRGPARRHREAAAQRRLLLLRDGDLRRPRLRLPLRLPRPPPPRGDPRAPRARVRPRPHHHRPLGRSTASTRPTARMLELHNPADMPDPVRIDHIEEPRIKATILVPDDYLGDVLKLCQDRRGVQLDLTYAGSRAMVVYDLPLERGGLRLLRPPEVRHQGLRLLRLPPDRLPGGRPRQDADPRQRRAGRRPLDHGPPRPRRRSAAAPWSRS